MKAGRVAQIGSYRQLLQLRPHILIGKSGLIVAGWLHIGRGKRQLTLYTTATMTLEALRDELEVALTDFDVPVKVFDKNIKTEEVTMSQPEYATPKEIRKAIVDDDQWALFELIADNVARVRSLQSQIAELTTQVRQAKAETADLFNSDR
jgi:hypothetical protein